MDKRRIKEREDTFLNWEYQPPMNPQMMIYDFYFLSLFQNGIPNPPSILDKSKSGIEDFEPHLNRGIIEATEKIVNVLSPVLIKAVAWCLSAEFRHIFDSKENIGLLQQGKKVVRQTGSNNLEGDPNTGETIKVDMSPQTIEFTKAWAQYYFKGSPEWMNKIGNPKNPDIPRSEIEGAYKAGFLKAEKPGRDGDLIPARINSYKATLRAIKALKIKSWEYGQIAEEAFRGFQFGSSFGGTRWADAAEGFTRLCMAEKSKSVKERFIWVDHIFDLEHNSGILLNKVSFFRSRHQEHLWIKEILDWKRNVKDIRGYYNKVSPSLKPVVAYIAKNVFELGSMEQFSQTEEGENEEQFTPAFKTGYPDYSPQAMAQYKKQLDQTQAEIKGEEKEVVKEASKKKPKSVLIKNQKPEQPNPSVGTSPRKIINSPEELGGKKPETPYVSKYLQPQGGLLSRAKASITGQPPITTSYTSNVKPYHPKEEFPRIRVGEHYLYVSHRPGYGSGYSYSAAPAASQWNMNFTDLLGDRYGEAGRRSYEGENYFEEPEWLKKEKELSKEEEDDLLFGNDPTGMYDLTQGSRRQKWNNDTKTWEDVDLHTGQSKEANAGWWDRSKWQSKYGGGQSILPISKPAPVVKDDKSVAPYIDELKSRDITTVVLLLDEEDIKEHYEKDIRGYYGEADINVLHFPIEDRKPPTDVRKFHILQRQVTQRLKTENVLIHCSAGLGRTGTVLCGFLIYHGMPYKEALKATKRKRAGAVETEEQKSFLKTYEKYVIIWRRSMQKYESRKR